MATVTGLTAARMEEIEAASVVSGTIDGDNLILTKHDGSTIDAGDVRGPQGDVGPTGPTGSANPAGTVLMFAGGTIPSDYHLCDGAALSRTTYATLFAAIGTAYGAGNGSTTFNIPLMTSNFPRGNSPGASGGLSSHSHTLSDAGQAAIEILAATSPANVERRVTSATWTATHGATGSAAAANTTSQSTGAALTGTTDSTTTIPPWIGFAFIIKT